MNLEENLKVTGLIITIVSLVGAALWKIFIHNKNSPYVIKKREAYDKAFQNIVVATIPRLSSFDWRAIEQGIVAPKEFEELKEKGIISQKGINIDSKATIAICSIIEESDKYIPKYTYENCEDPTRKAQALENCKTWMRSRLKNGEKYLNENRLYIKKKHRDLFREYLIFAMKFVDDQSESTLDEVVKRRNQIEDIMSSILR